MAKKKTAQKLEQEDFASESGEQNLNEDKTQDEADAKLLQESISTPQPLAAEDKVDPCLVDLAYGQVYHEAAEDADDELDSEEDNDYEEVQPLMVKKTKTDSDQGMQHLLCVFELVAAEKTLSPRESRLKVHLLVHLSTNHPEQNTQITANTHGFVNWANNVAQAGKSKLHSFSQFKTDLVGRAAHPDV